MAGAVTGGGVSLRCRSMGAGSRRRLPHVSQPLGEALGTPPNSQCVVVTAVHCVLHGHSRPQSCVRAREASVSLSVTCGHWHLNQCAPRSGNSVGFKNVPWEH